MNFTYRKAELTDTENLEKLIEKSAKSINSAYYSEKEINSALGNAWTVDQQLISDKTYWIVEDMDGTVIGCGGWSKRKLLFGKSTEPNTIENELIPGIDSARIRAFFVHPNYTRMGIGKELIEKCEKEAISKGFNSMEIVATLSGEKLYSSKGYISIKTYEIDLGNGITNKVVSMNKHLK
jgi:N-acetylglutamate synthase-like GNAT family acetyltransferase